MIAFGNVSEAYAVITGTSIYGDLVSQFLDFMM